MQVAACLFVVDCFVDFGTKRGRRSMRTIYCCCHTPKNGMSRLKRAKVETVLCRCDGVNKYTS